MTDQADPTDAFTLATPQQILNYILLLGVPQRQLARQLGVTTSAVSMWVTRTRPVPASYRPALLEWAGVAYQQAVARHQKEVAALETDALKIASIEAFQAPLTRWYVEVLHAADVLQERALKNARELTQILKHKPLTVDDLEQIRSLKLVLRNQLDWLAELGGVLGEDTTPAPEA
jgi:hypothetical protein